MKPVLRGVHSPDAYDLDTFTTPDRAFAVLVQLYVGPDNGQGEESFDVLVCSPDWLRNESGPTIGRHRLIVNDFDWDRILTFIREQISAIEESTWEEVATKLGRIGHWEFEDYH